MPHAYSYHGGFEANHSRLAVGATTFIGSDGAEHALAAWPDGPDGVHIGYMEKPGKNFVAVRVKFNRTDIVLDHEVLIDPILHLGAGKRFSPEPTIVHDDAVRAFLLEIIRKNPEYRIQLEAIRNRVPGK